MTKVKCRLCNNWMEQTSKDEFRDEFWCEFCGIEIGINHDQDEIEIRQERPPKHG